MSLFVCETIGNIDTLNYSLHSEIHQIPDFRELIMTLLFKVLLYELNHTLSPRLAIVWI